MSDQRQASNTTNSMSLNATTNAGLNTRTLSASVPNGVMQGGGQMPGGQQIPQVQVIHQSMPTPPYLSQFPYNQQFMLQNAAAIQAAMQAQVMNSQFNLAALQGRVTSVSPQSPTVPAVMCPSSVTMPSQPMVTVPSTPTPGVTMATSQSPTTSTNSRMATNAKSPTNGGQPTMAMMNKAQTQFVQRHMASAAASQPIVIGQLSGVGMMPGQNHNFLPNQGDMTSKSGGQLSSPPHPQVFSSQSQLRMSSQPQQLASNAQIFTPSMIAANPALFQAMANFPQGLPFAHITGQIPGQPLYIRAAGLVQPQANVVQPTQAPTVSVTKAQQQQLQQQHQQQQAHSNKATEVYNDQSVKQSGVVTAKTNHQNRILSTILPMSSKPAAVTAKVQPTNVGPGATTAKVQPTTYALTKQAKTSTPPRLNIPQVPGAVTKIATATKARQKQPKCTTVAAAIAQGKSAKQPATGQLTPAPATTSVAQPVKPTPATSTVAPCVASPMTSTPRPIQTTVSVPTPKVQHQSVTSAPKTTAPTVTPSMNKSTMAGADTVSCVVSEKRPKPLAKPATVLEKQKAVVKPQILTHVIDGFIIQEGPEPFPIQRSSLLTEFMPPMSYNHKISEESEEEDGPPCLTLEHSPNENRAPASVHKCEYCGKVDKDKKFRRSKRFCSMACTKRYNHGFSRRWDKHSGDGSQPSSEQLNTAETLKLSRKRKHSLKPHRSTWHIERPAKVLPNTSEYMSGGDDQSSSLGDRESSSSPPNTPPSQRAVSEDTASPPSTNPATWTVQQVYEFVHSIKGCNIYAEEFRSQEIDGQALLLLKEDHLMSAMTMKLGPALKICAQISAIKQGFS